MRSTTFIRGLSCMMSAVSLLLGGCASGPRPLRDAQGKTLPHSLESWEWIRLGGVDQRILIRSQDTRNPLLIFVHGGPGMSETPWLRKFNGSLESRFTVVYWDQRGAGKSYSPSIDPATLTTDRIAEDLRELVLALGPRFGQSKAFVAAHSFGTITGIKAISRWPELFHAYVGISQFADARKGEHEAFAATLAAARAAKDAKAERQLLSFTHYPDDPSDLTVYMEELGQQRMLAPRLGGMTKGGRDFLGKLGMVTDEYYNVFDYMGMMDACVLSAKRMIPDMVATMRFMDEQTEFQIPVFFLGGTADLFTPASVARDYLDRITAPEKGFVLYEQSAHCPNFEEPQKFIDFMLAIRRFAGPSGTSAHAPAARP